MAKRGERKEAFELFNISLQKLQTLMTFFPCSPPAAAKLSAETFIMISEHRKLLKVSTKETSE